MDKLVSPRQKAAHQTLVAVLNVIGINSLEDTTSIAPVDCFENLSQDLVLKLATDYRLSYVLPDNVVGDPNKEGIVEIKLDAERKLELVNRVLELKHGMILDSLKYNDNDPKDIGTDRELKGYKLEKLDGR